jgi:hypothetical protein
MKISDPHCGNNDPALQPDHGLDMEKIAHALAMLNSQGPKDAGATAAIAQLPKHGMVEGEQTAKMIRDATSDKDGNAAGLEHTEVMKWARDNWDRLSPESKQMIEIYDKECQKSLSNHSTGIESKAYDRMMGDIDALVPKRGDESADAAIAKLENSHGPISGEAMQAAIKDGVGDADGQAAGKEFDAFMKFQSENRSRLSPEASKVLDIYERYARQAQAKGQTGIPQDQFDKMMTEMKAVHTYADKGAGVELDALSKKGMVGGPDLMKAIERGTRDHDGQAAGLEFADFSKWAHENEGRLGGSAKEVFGIYEKYARKAQSEGHTGLSPQETKHMLHEMRQAIEHHNQDHQFHRVHG